MPEISEYYNYYNYYATNIRTTFNKFRIIWIGGDLFCSLSSNLGSNHEIVDGSIYLGKYLPERMNLVEKAIYC
jgi:hypothetical protein